MYKPGGFLEVLPIIALVLCLQKILFRIFYNEQTFKNILMNVSWVCLICIIHISKFWQGDEYKWLNKNS